MNLLPNLPAAKPQAEPSTTKTAIEPEIQNRLLTLKLGDIVRTRTKKKKTLDEKGSVIGPNDRPHSYNAINEKGNLIIRNRFQLIPANEKFIVNHKYDNIIELSKATLQKTVVQARADITSNIAPPVRTKSKHIKKPKRYLNKNWLVSQISANWRNWILLKTNKLSWTNWVIF